MRDAKIIGAIVLALLVVVFVLQNTQPVQVVLLAWTWTASRSLVLLAVFVAGAATGWLARAARSARYRRR